MLNPSPSFALACGLFLAVHIPAPTFAVQYTVTGKATLTGFRPDHTGAVHTATHVFKLTVDDCRWIIRTSETDIETQYVETGSESNRIYSIRVDSPGAAQREYVASAQIDPGDVPRIYHSPLHSVLWLSFCSPCRLDKGPPGMLPHLLNLTTRNPQHHNLEIDYWEWNLPSLIERSETSPRLPTKVVCLDDGIIRYWAKPQQFLAMAPATKPWRAPFEKGFTNFIYAVSESTNLAGLSLPRTALLSMYAPRPAAQLASDLFLFRTFQMAAESFVVQELASVVTVPKLPGRTVFNDFRFATRTNERVFGINYRTEANWLTDEQFEKLPEYLNAVHHQRQITPGIAASGPSHLGNSRVMIVIVILMSIMMLTIWTQYSSKRKENKTVKL